MHLCIILPRGLSDHLDWRTHEDYLFRSIVSISIQLIDRIICNVRQIKTQLLETHFGRVFHVLSCANDQWDSVNMFLYYRHGFELCDIRKYSRKNYSVVNSHCYKTITSFYCPLQQHTVAVQRKYYCFLNARPRVLLLCLLWILVFHIRIKPYLKIHLFPDVTDK